MDDYQDFEEQDAQIFPTKMAYQIKYLEQDLQPIIDTKWQALKANIFSTFRYTVITIRKLLFQLNSIHQMIQTQRKHLHQTLQSEYERCLQERDRFMGKYNQYFRKIKYINEYVFEIASHESSWDKLKSCFPSLYEAENKFSYSNSLPRVNFPEGVEKQEQRTKILDKKKIKEKGGKDPQMKKT